MKFRLRLHVIPYRWLDKADTWLHRRGDHTGWDWLCYVKDRRLGWQDEDRLWPWWAPHKQKYGDPVRFEIRD